METRYPVVFLSGGVLPAEPAYAALLQVLGGRVVAVTKDLEVYSGGRPPPDYGLGIEVEGILREAEAHGFDRFNLVGYSGGGAASLAFAAQHGERLLSLALLEPAWAGNDRTAEEDALMRRFGTLLPLPPDEFMADSCGCSSPPALSHHRLRRVAAAVDGPAARGSASPHRRLRQRRPRRRSASGVQAAGVFRTRRSKQPRLRRSDGPDRLAAVFPDFTIETFPERHHFDPPHRIEPEHLAHSLVAHWQPADE